MRRGPRARHHDVADDACASLAKQNQPSRRQSRGTMPNFRPLTTAALLGSRADQKGPQLWCFPRRRISPRFPPARIFHCSTALLATTLPVLARRFEWTEGPWDMGSCPPPCWSVSVGLQNPRHRRPQGLLHQILQRRRGGASRREQGSQLGRRVPVCGSTDVCSPAQCPAVLARACAPETWVSSLASHSTRCCRYFPRDPSQPAVCLMSTAVLPPSRPRSTRRRAERHAPLGVGLDARDPRQE